MDKLIDYLRTNPGRMEIRDYLTDLIMQMEALRTNEPTCDLHLEKHHEEVGSLQRDISALQYIESSAKPYDENQEYQILLNEVGALTSRYLKLARGTNDREMANNALDIAEKLRSI